MNPGYHDAKKRRLYARKTDIYEYNLGNYKFICREQKLYIDNEVIQLSIKESELLRLLLENKENILGRKLALKTIWQSDDYFNRRSMDVYISKLRKHFIKDQNIKIINVHSKGFILTDKANN